jgi:hypothetical protein
MLEFWKQPKFWLVTILILWLAYVIGSNLEQVVVIHIVPLLLQPYCKVSTIVIASGIVGALLTIGAQFAWRSGRASKNAVQSAPAPGTNSSTVA